MASSSDHPAEGGDDTVDLSKSATGGSAADEPFDPYRFGRPEQPIAPEFAPPGYRPDAAAPPPAHPPTGYPYPPMPSGPGQSPYPPYGGAAPNYPYGPPWERARPGHGKAVAALAVGIGSIVMAWTSIFDVVLVVIAVVLGIVALNEMRRSVGQPGSDRGMAIAGIVCAAVGAVLAIVWTVFAVHLANQCGGLDQRDSSGFQQCIQDHL